MAQPWRNMTQSATKATILAVVVVAGVCYLINPYGVPTLSPIARLLGHQDFYVPSGSMEPAIPAGSTVRVCFGERRSFTVGDIVAFPVGGIIQLKRIAALGASSIEIGSGGISVNGEPAGRWFVVGSDGAVKEGQFRVPEGNAFCSETIWGRAMTADTSVRSQSSVYLDAFARIQCPGRASCEPPSKRMQRARHTDNVIPRSRHRRVADARRYATPCATVVQRKWRIEMLFRHLFFFALMSQPVAAADSLQELSAGEYDRLEKAFTALQTRFEAKTASEYELLDAYKVFYLNEDKYNAQLGGWINLYPKSSSAYLARGVYYRKLGEARRGTDYVSKVPGDNLRYMQESFQLAKADLKRSLDLNPKSYLAILHLLNIAQFESDNQASDKYLQLANAVLPSNFLVRARYLLHLAPRWGGTYTAMENFIDRAKREVPGDMIDWMNAIKGKVAEERGDIPKARADFEAALRLSRSGGSRLRRDYLFGSLRLCAEPTHAAEDYCR